MEMIILDKQAWFDLLQDPPPAKRLQLADDWDDGEHCLATKYF